MFEPNKNGLVVVKMLKNYAANVAGETAGFLPEIAKALVKDGIAHLPGEAPKKSDEPTDDGAEVLTSLPKALQIIG